MWLGREDEDFENNEKDGRKMMDLRNTRITITGGSVPGSCPMVVFGISSV
jgi:hypothetical protein